MRVTRDYGLISSKLEHDLLVRLNRDSIVAHMKAEFKNGYWTACYGGSVLYEKSTLQRMTKADLIELIECA